MYQRIVICLVGKEDDVLAKQIEMLKERHHAEVLRVDAETARELLCGGTKDGGTLELLDGEAKALFISDNEELLALAQSKGVATNDPQKMRESYMKAMDMLKALGIPKG